MKSASDLGVPVSSIGDLILGRGRNAKLALRSIYDPTISMGVQGGVIPQRIKKFTIIEDFEPWEYPPFRWCAKFRNLIGPGFTPAVGYLCLYTLGFSF